MRTAVLLGVAWLMAMVSVPGTGQFAAADKSSVETKHLKIATSSVVSGNGRVSLFVDVEPKPKMHVYAPGQTDYIPIELTVTREPAFRVLRPQFPQAEQFFFAPLNQTQRVYSKPFRITQPIAIGSRPETNDLTIKGKVRYQACDDAICYVPQTVDVTWTVALTRKSR
jgi:DsbC/DsbD-like thiol-disulfide interchange protein